MKRLKRFNEALDPYLSRDKEAITKLKEEAEETLEYLVREVEDLYSDYSKDKFEIKLDDTTKENGMPNFYITLKYKMSIIYKSDNNFINQNMPSPEKCLSNLNEFQKITDLVQYLFKSIINTGLFKITHFELANFTNKPGNMTWYIGVRIKNDL